MNKTEIKKLSYFRQELALWQKEHRERGDHELARIAEHKLSVLEYIESLLGISLK
jgi:hypothetical protein